MCLLVLFHRIFPGRPLVLCANRDEFFDRPSEPPSLRRAEGGDHPFIAPRDARAGGTWLGLNRASAVAALTNRKGMDRLKNAPSRGLLVERVLAGSDARGMALLGLEEAGRERLNGFNLLVADGRRAFLLVGGGASVAFRAFEPGIHVLTNEHEPDAIPPPDPEAGFSTEGSVAAESRNAATTERWRRAFEKDTSRAFEARLIRLLGTHETPLAGGFTPCKHLSDRGTRSSAILIPAPDAPRFLYAPGPPCVTPFTELHELTSRLMANPMSASQEDGTARDPGPDSTRS